MLKGVPINQRRRIHDDAIDTSAIQPCSARPPRSGIHIDASGDRVA
jgi:hypothetical protein